MLVLVVGPFWPIFIATVHCLVSASVLTHLSENNVLLFIRQYMFLLLLRNQVELLCKRDLTESTLIPTGEC